ncbi:hypothetical protein OC846_003319 [Tilletia horrida]|uniref:Ribonuclease H2 subunit B wHTH domain-containing protein n=1 Tax=Tilletia horrida TaxID=155126 RepID=A0AAN6GQN0_9BASI|nr:hypothetical protein OC846_003319 [Tilletia horrida]KAK0568620.1 hypothetical protein OC861_001782 [Tilletia horrida]
MSSSSSSSNNIITHSGTHHADEALAVYMLRKLPQYQSLPLIRTRDQAVIDQGTIVVDVGAEYDPARHRYDHHQRGFEETFDAQHSIKLSSAGLVWKHFGTQILAAHLKLPQDDARIALLHLKLYDDFVQGIDAIDNGISQFPASAGQPLYKNKTDLSSRVGHTNPRWNQPTSSADQDARFERASTMAGTEFFERVDDTFEAWLPARDIVVKALDARKTVTGGDAQGRILVFDEFASWKDHLFQLESDLAIPQSERVFYVVYPDESGKWRVQAVPINADSFVSRKALPEPWRGIRDDALSKITGIEGCIFVHQSGFIGGNATKDGALEMARKAVAHTEPPHPLTSPIFPAGARPIVLLGPSSVVAPLPSGDSSAIFSDSNDASTGLPDGLQIANAPAVRHRFLSLPHPSSGAPSYYALYQRDESSKAGKKPAGSSSIPGLAELNLDPASKLDGLLELHMIRPDAVERSWFVGSTGAIHTPVPGSAAAKAAQKAELAEELEARVKREAEAQARYAVKKEAAEQQQQQQQQQMEVDGVKETQIGEEEEKDAGLKFATRSTFRRPKPQFTGQVISDGAVHMLVPVDPVFLLIPLLSLVAPSEESGPARFQPADDLFDELAMAAFRRLAHKHNERVTAAAAAKPTNNGAAQRGKGKSAKGKNRQSEPDEEGPELLEEEGVWADIIKLGASRAGTDAMHRICDSHSIGNGMSVFRFNRTKTLALLQSKVQAINDKDAFAGAPSTLGRSYARTLSAQRDDDADGDGDDMDVDSAAPPDSTDAQETAAQTRESKVRLRVALGAVSAWLDAEWRERLEDSLFGSSGDERGDEPIADAAAA